VNNHIQNKRQVKNTKHQHKKLRGKKKIQKLCIIKKEIKNLTHKENSKRIG